MSRELPIMGSWSVLQVTFIYVVLISVVTAQVPEQQSLTVPDGQVLEYASNSSVLQPPPAAVAVPSANGTSRADRRKLSILLLVLFMVHKREDSVSFS